MWIKLTKNKNYAIFSVKKGLTYIGKGKYLWIMLSEFINEV